MGAAGSVRRNPALMQAEVERLREKELDLMEEHSKQIEAEEMKHKARLVKLEAEKYELAENLRETTSKLNDQTEKWKKEQAKALSLMFSDLPLHMLKSENLDLPKTELNSMMTRSFPMVTVAQCDIVGFSSLSARLPPDQMIHVIDRLHALIDEAFTDRDIFTMERTSDGCIAVSGLYDFPDEDITKRQETFTPVSMSDSSYGSQINFDHDTKEENMDRLKLEIDKEGEAWVKTSPIYHAGIIATASLKLMSYSNKISVPLPENQTLQLRIALHSGPCTAGVVGLQTATGVSRVPHYKLFGPTIRHLRTLCSTGLALQVRVSKQCRELLMKAGGYSFERCPDYMVVSNRKPIESYWLVAKEDLPLKLPSLSNAVSLWDYDDIIEP